MMTLTSVINIPTQKRIQQILLYGEVNLIMNPDEGTFFSARTLVNLTIQI